MKRSKLFLVMIVFVLSTIGCKPELEKITESVEEQKQEECFIFNGKKYQVGSTVYLPARIEAVYYNGDFSAVIVSVKDKRYEYTKPRIFVDFNDVKMLRKYKVTTIYDYNEVEDVYE